MSRLKKFIASNISRRSDKTRKISPLAYVDNHSTIDHHTYIDRFCILHNINLQAYSYLGYGCKLTNVNIGRYCSIASDVKIGLGKHPIHLLSSSPVFYSDKNPFNIKLNDKLNYDDTNKETIIGNDVWIGANVIIMDGITIGNGSVIGSGSIVTKDIPEYSIAVGSPAKVLRKRFENHIIAKINEVKWWELEPEQVQNLDIYQYFKGEQQ